MPSSDILERGAMPALTILKITPDSARCRAAIAHALAGPGAPVGVTSVRETGDAVVVEFDAARSEVALIVAVVDAEIGAAGRRVIEPLAPLDDAALTAFCAELLGDPAIDTSRLIETYLQPMLLESP